MRVYYVDMFLIAFVVGILNLKVITVTIMGLVVVGWLANCREKKVELIVIISLKKRTKERRVLFWDFYEMLKMHSCPNK